MGKRLLNPIQTLAIQRRTALKRFFRAECLIVIRHERRGIGHRAADRPHGVQILRRIGAAQPDLHCIEPFTPQCLGLYTQRVRIRQSQPIAVLS